MTPEEFEAFRSRIIAEYADEQVRSGNWSAATAQARASGRTAELAPEGSKTPGMLALTAETDKGETVGHLWLGMVHDPADAPSAWIYAIDVTESQRAKGYGRALLAGAEQEAARHGATAIGLNVFGTNQVARHLYESADYEVVSQQMRKRLNSPS
jgi:ribosomal protein S18 acetylase RimI-like enzyme